MSSLLTEHKITASPRAIRILGWSKTTLLDYPGRVASTLFLEGCNFRCPYCHNPELVSPNGGKPLDPSEILHYLSTYSRMLEGVCITGGEPLLQGALPRLCISIRQLGLRVKVDTNGSLPQKLKPLLEASLLDYVAVDIKGPPEKIAAIAGNGSEQDQLVAATEMTLGLLRASGIPYELRTTLVPGLLEADDLHGIGKWLGGCPRFVLQQFSPGNTLDPFFRDLSPYPPQYLCDLAGSLSTYFADCTVRGIG